MKRNAWISLILATVLLVPLMLAAAPAYAEGDTELKGTVNTTTLNVRKGPGTKHAVIGQLNRGAEVIIRNATGNWLQIETADKKVSGYVSGRYIVLTAGAEAIAVTRGSVNVRSDATASSTKVDTLLNDSAMAITGAAKGYWYPIRVLKSGKTGYISGRYIRIICKVSAGLSAPTVSGNSRAATISGRNVNFRTGPSAKFKSLGLLKFGTAMTVYEASGNWYHVQLADGRTGYVFGRYVAFSAATASPATSSSPTATAGARQEGVLTGDRVNLRTGASAKTASQGKLRRGTEFYVLGKTGNWYQVELKSGGKTGYLFAKYVRLLPLASATPSPTVTPTAPATATPTAPPTATPTTPPTATPSASASTSPSASASTSPSSSTTP